MIKHILCKGGNPNRPENRHFCIGTVKGIRHFIVGWGIGVWKEGDGTHTHRHACVQETTGGGTKLDKANIKDSGSITHTRAHTTLLSIFCVKGGDPVDPRIVYWDHERTSPLFHWLEN